MEAKDFISHLLVVDARRRYDTKQALAHPYIIKNCPEQTVKPATPQAASAPIVDAFTSSEGQDQVMNIAQRVSTNLRTRGASVTRRRSTDAGGKQRVTPHRQPALPEPLAPKTELTAEMKEMLDSGVVADSVSALDKERLAQIEAMVGNRQLANAYLLLQQVEVPSTLREKYERLIFKATAGNGATGVLVGATPMKTASVTTKPKQQTVTTRTVRFLSLNLMIHPPGVKSRSCGYKDARIDFFCKHILGDYDVIALQDVYAFGSRRREILIERAYAQGFRYWVSSSAKGFLDQAASKSPAGAATDATAAVSSKTNMDGGLLILSRFSIRRCERMTYDRGVGEDK